MSFADNIVPDAVQELRQRLLYHPLRQHIEDGTLEKARLRLFALSYYSLSSSYSFVASCSVSLSAVRAV